MRPTFSVIAPIFNEIQNIPELYRRVAETLESAGEPWELLLVDDGSGDGCQPAVQFHAGRQPSTYAYQERPFEQLILIIY